MIIYNLKAFVSVGIPAAATFLYMQYVLAEHFPDAEWGMASVFFVFGGLCFIVDWMLKINGKKEDQMGSGGTVFFIPVWFWSLLVIGLGVFILVNPQEFERQKEKIPDAPTVEDLPDIPKPEQKPAEKEKPIGPVTSDKNRDL